MLEELKCRNCGQTSLVYEGNEAGAARYRCKFCGSIYLRDLPAQPFPPTVPAPWPVLPPQPVNPYWEPLPRHKVIWNGNTNGTWNGNTNGTWSDQKTGSISYVGNGYIYVSD